MSTAESLLLGLILNDGKSFDVAAVCGVTARHFQEPIYGEIWDAVERATKASLNFDPAMVALTIKNEMAPMKVADLITGAPVGMSAEYFANEVVEADWARRTAVDLSRLANRLYERKPFDTDRRAEVTTMVKAMSEVTPTSFASQEPMALVADFNRELEKAISDHHEGKEPGISTGLRDLDELTMGWRPATLNVIGARTSCGKTTLACNFAASAALAGKQVAYFTVEMRATKIVGKIVSLLASINGAKISKGRLNEDEQQKVYQCGEKIGGLGLRVNDVAGRTIETVEREAWRLHRQGKLDLLIIDYIQQLYWPSRRWVSRQAELSAITASLQDLSHRLGIPVIALAQLNRQAESLPPDQAPGKHHLKDSGSLEQDADVIVIVHRPQPKSPTGITHLVIDKCRDGQCATIQVEVDMATNRFSNWRL